MQHPPRSVICMQRQSGNFHVFRTAPELAERRELKIDINTDTTI